MTDVEKIAAILRDRGAAYAEFDDSSTDGNCWIVETRDDWFTGVAEEIVAALKPEATR